MCTDRVFIALKFFLFIVLLAVASSARASIFVVDDSYNGVNSATACEQPAGATFYSSITDARLAAGTDLNIPHNMRICPGTYSEHNLFNDPQLIGMSIEGTTGNPSDVFINGPNTALAVFDFRHSNMSLENLTITGGQWGVRTLNSDSTVLDNLIINNQALEGILIQSNDNSILNTSIENTGRRGILFSGVGENLLIQSVKVASTILDCVHSNRGGVIMKDVSVQDCQRFGAYFNKIAGPSSLSIDNFTSDKTEFEGLYIRDYDASAATDNVKVTNVQISNAGRFGFYLVNNISLNISNLKVDTTINDGVVLNNTVSSVLEDISVNNASGDGMSFNPTTSQNQLRRIRIDNSNVIGFYNNGGDENTIEGIVISNTTGNNGIYFGNAAQDNSITDYESYNSLYGVTLSNSQRNTFSQGIIHSNTYGIRITSGAESNQFFDNYVHDNSAVGLSIINTGANVDNSFYSNCFINPVDNIIDLEAGSVNLFDNGTIGNYYGSSPAGTGFSETCIDADSNTICDASYVIPSVLTDRDNFPTRDLSSIDAACFADAITLPQINFKKTLEVISDPVNNTLNPKAIPGAIVAYTLEVTNSGTGDSDNNSIMIVDDLPANTRLMLGSPANPIVFNDGSPSSGLSFSFGGLNSTTDDIEFSNDGGATFITPSADVDGLDISSPPINYIKLSPKGVLGGDSGSGSPNFTMTYQVEVK